MDKPPLFLVEASRVLREGESIVVDFYGKQIHFYYDADLKQKLSKRIDKESVSEYWSALSQTDYDPLLIQLKARCITILQPVFYMYA